ncbi:hypothetical protein GCM10027269_30200 [Kribbella endophytica]
MGWRTELRWDWNGGGPASVARPGWSWRSRVRRRRGLARGAEVDWNGVGLRVRCEAGVEWRSWVRQWRGLACVAEVG